MKIKELLSSPERWTQRQMAADSAGYPVGIYDPSAVSFCLLGAGMKCYPDFGTGHPVYETLRALLPKGHGVMSFNDSATFEEVCRLLEIADV